MRKFILLTILITLISFSLTTIKETSGKEKKSKKTELIKEEKDKKKVEINEIEFKPVFIGALLENPSDFIEKKIKFRGKFSSFTTLALDYEPALRKSKDYISICIFRPDSKIPLSELKLAYPIKEAKENLVIRELEEGDLIEIYAQVFNAALGEPWADIISIKKLESNSKKQDDKSEEKGLNNKDKKGKKDSK